MSYYTEVRGRQRAFEPVERMSMGVTKGVHIFHRHYLMNMTIVRVYVVLSSVSNMVSSKKMHPLSFESSFAIATLD